MASNPSAPAAATEAVLKPSEPVPEGVQEVQGIDFNQYASRPITVDELIGGYANMGFQATSVGEAVRIINDMVSWLHACLPACFCPDRPRVPASSAETALALAYAAGNAARPCAAPGRNV
jgi:deoxyhypusine synthase